MTTLELVSEEVTILVSDEDDTILISDVGTQGPPGGVHESYPFTMSDELELAVGKTFLPFDYDGTIISVQIVNRVEADEDIIVDVLLNDVSIWDDPGSLPTIPSGSFKTAILVTLIDSPDVVAGDLMSVDVVQVGTDSQRGRDLVATVRVLKNA